jgi:hypothetical protein
MPTPHFAQGPLSQQEELGFPPTDMETGGGLLPPPNEDAGLGELDWEAGDVGRGELDWGARLGTSDWPELHLPTRLNSPPPPMPVRICLLTLSG